MKSNLTRTALCALFIAMTAPAQAVLVINLPGTSDYEGWSDLTAANNPGYPNFPTAGNPWPAPIAPNEAGSAGNAAFNKVSGNGYPGTAAVYSPFTSSEYAITGTSSFDIETVVFQIDFGPGDGGNFFDALPTLSYNGGSQSLAADFALTAAGNYSFTNPNPGSSESGTTTLFGYQWDLTGLGSITSYSIEWQVHPHSQMYEMQTNTGSSFSQAIPEPSTAALIGLATTGLVMLRRRRKTAATH